MHQSDPHSNQRQNSRVTVNLTVKISFGSQVTLTGRVRDLSLKSAFILVRSGVHMQLNDELTFVIDHPSGPTHRGVEGIARISRVSAGEGIAIYFTRLDEESLAQLKAWVLE
jgi:hypothetical protein